MEEKFESLFFILVLEKVNSYLSMQILLIQKHQEIWQQFCMYLCVHKQSNLDCYESKLIFNLVKNEWQPWLVLFKMTLILNFCELSH